jgi:hypothetical protein
MNKEFIPYEQALELKELGFDDKCFAYYNNFGITYNRIKNSDNLVEAEHIKGNWCSTPLYQQAFRWFRETHNIDCYIETKSLTIGGSTFDYTIIADEEEEWDDGKRWRTYEEAELACLKKLIEIAKQK